MAWLLTFCGIFLELPISQLLYAPGSPPASVAIEDNLGNYHFGIGHGPGGPRGAHRLGPRSGVVLGGYRLLRARRLASDRRGTRG